MPDQSVIVWDLETVPDLAAAARMLDLGNATEAEVREAIGPGFPKHPLHKIACIGALIASRQPEGWRVEALGAPHIGERCEAKLISDFVEKIGQLRPQLVTFNGHSFDLPVLRYRAMVNRLSAVGLQNVEARCGAALFARCASVLRFFFRRDRDALFPKGPTFWHLIQKLTTKRRNPHPIPVVLEQGAQDRQLGKACFLVIAHRWLAAEAKV